MNLKLNHIQHIGVPVTNIQASEAFYERLGFKNVMATTFQYNGGMGNVAMMKRDAMIIELYQMPEAELAAIRNRKNQETLLRPGIPEIFFHQYVISYSCHRFFCEFSQAIYVSADPPGLSAASGVKGTNQ